MQPLCPIALCLVWLASSWLLLRAAPASAALCTPSVELEAGVTERWPELE